MKLNMYDLSPCPKCGSEFRAPYVRDGQARAECDDCGYVESAPAGHYAWANAEPCEPYVCPGCHTVGGGPCAPGCIDDEIEREREERQLYGDPSERYCDADDEQEPIP